MRALPERYKPKLNSSNILKHVFYDISDTDSISVFRLKQNCFYSVMVLPSYKQLPLHRPTTFQANIYFGRERKAHALWVKLGKSSPRV